LVPSTVPTIRGLVPFEKTKLPVVAAARTRTLLVLLPNDTGPYEATRRLPTVRRANVPWVMVAVLFRVRVFQPAGATIGALKVIGPARLSPIWSTPAVTLFNSACVSPMDPAVLEPMLML